MDELLLAENEDESLTTQSALSIWRLRARARELQIWNSWPRASYAESMASCAQAMAASNGGSHHFSGAGREDDDGSTISCIAGSRSRIWRTRPSRSKSRNPQSMDLGRTLVLMTKAGAELVFHRKYVRNLLL